MKIEGLKILGLTNNEVNIYITILKKGKSTATEIRKATSIVNSRVYAAIDTLIGKGLVVYEKTSGGKIYSALDPGVLKDLMSEEMKKISECIPLLKGLQKKSAKETESGVYEGFKGFKTAMYNLAEECPAGETIYIIGFSNQAYKNEKLAALLREVNKISVKKKHKFKMILDNKENKFYQQRKEEKISNIRFMEKGFRSPAAIDIFKDTVYILLWEELPYAFKIKNKNIADGFKVYFNFLWNISVK